MLFLVACGQEGSGNFSVKGGLASSSSSIVQMSDYMDVTHSLGLSSKGDIHINATSGLDPANFYMRIYKVGFSKSTDCTNMTVIPVSENPSPQDWVQTPNIVTGDLSDGTYPCMAFEFSSMITVVPSETTDNESCQAGVSFDLDVCSSGTSTLLDGTTNTCSSGSDDRRVHYISTTGNSGNNCGNDCGLTPSNPGLLTSALVVSGSTSGKFTVDASGAIQENGGDCEMNEPTWGFE